jgi:hypothetical protein
MSNSDYVASIQAFTPTVDANAVSGIVKFLGIALKSRDASLVSCSSKSELERVRESFLKKKLKMTDPDADLDKHIEAICEQMKGAREKHRVTFYYLLASRVGKLAAV